ncbi:ATP-grasp domain-containing protein [Actinospica durhamensis]|uniref:ATP-grasp domain-containing protein n=1 Tax=Actinospica durhamensis TaxID=1508375 RepID=A0A941ELR3_9ACTN|nr:ATP-grasp domain-containing protein [Actinospica durhamensis]MBR7833451.1 ATP-grasp domain-containing protein [Actinospica durhamensis]
MFPLRLDLDAPAELDEHLHEVAFDLWARWHLEPEHARSIVESFVTDEDLHSPYSELHTHELPSYWAGHLYHRHVHGCGDDTCPPTGRSEALSPNPAALSQGSALLVSAQPTSTTTLLAEAAARRGLAVHELTDPAELQTLAGRDVYWYGGPRAALRAVRELKIGLLEPLDEWLTLLPHRFLGREIALSTLADAWRLTRPAFVKPPREKSLPAAVYADGTRLPRTGNELTPETAVLISEVVTFAVEYRLFVLDGEIVTGSRYAVYGRLDPAPLTGDPNEQAVREFFAALLPPPRTDSTVLTSLTSLTSLTALTAERMGTDRMGTGMIPSAFVLDVGLIESPDTGAQQWAVVEANMAWFAHCYAADPDRVLDVVLRSAGPLHRVAVNDFAYLRPIEATRMGPVPS